jgi:hypothetical protein
MSKPTEPTVAKTTQEYVDWVRDNPHHHGWWTGVGTDDEALNLEGHDAWIKIPRSVHVSGAIQPSDYKNTHRMFEPASAPPSLPTPS